MPRILCLLGLVVAGLVGLLFLADLGMSFAGSGGIFSYPSLMMDLAFIAASGMLGYLAWSALRELK
ncbi:MAG: hypothetical protein ACKOAU_16515 [Pirellula sp.]